MRKLITTIAVLTVMVLTVGLMGTAALAAPEEVLTLDIADGSLVISATGYSVNGAVETPYTGSYIITGTANTTGPHKTLTVTGVAADATVTLKDLTIITNGPPALTLYAPVKATGSRTIVASASSSTCCTVTALGCTCHP